MMSCSPSIYHRGYPIVTAGTYAAMVSALDDYKTAGHSEVVGELHTGGIVGPTSLIGRWRWNANAADYELLGPADVTRVTDSQYATIASGTGSTRTVDAGHNLPAAAQVDVWDVSAGSAIATDVAVTVSGNTVTFTAGDPGATAAGDLIHVRGRCEFGEIGDGYWTLSANAAAVWKSGFNVLEDDGTSNAHKQALFSVFGSSGAENNPSYVTTHMVLDVVESSATSLSYFGGGFYSDDEMAAHVLFNNAGTWTRYFLYNARSAPSASAETAASTPGTLTDIDLTCLILPNAAPGGSVQLLGQIEASGLTWGTISLAAVTDHFAGQGTDGPMDGVCVAWKHAGGGGTLELTVKQISTLWRL